LKAKSFKGTEANESEEAVLTSEKKSYSTSTIEDKIHLGLGMSADVPKHLRYKGKVPKRKLSRNDCYLLINEIWSAKAMYNNNNQQKGISISLAEFLFVYLKKRFGTQDAIAEWGYNLHFASKSFVDESVDCRLFYGILSGIRLLVLKKSIK
jgi:hypothetical protein